MKNYVVYIEEKLCRGTEIEAENIEQALDKAREMYRNSEIVLDSNDMGTGAEIMAQEVGINSEAISGESTDWNDL